MPETAKPKNDHALGSLLVNNIGINSGDIIDVDGVNYMVINTVLEIMTLDRDKQ